MPPWIPTLSKAEVHYQHGTVEEHYGNCDMFTLDTSPAISGHCKLVFEPISAHMVCDRWEARTTE